MTLSSCPPAARLVTARRVTLALLLAPPLIALALLAWATLAHHPRPVHTGDALLDEFLQAVADNELATSTRWLTLGQEKSALPTALWQRWERDYGADPRYWMLCYYYRPHDNAYGTAETNAFEPDVSYLDAARARGCVDWELLFMLLRARQSAWSREARDALALPMPPRKAPLDARQRYNARIWQELSARHGAEWTQLLAETLQAGAGQAQVHYYLARLAGERGAMEEAYAEVMVGNAAPGNAAGLGFPFSAMADAARQGQPLAGDAILTGLLRLDRNVFQVKSILRFRLTFRGMAKHALAQRNLGAMQSLHRACCRIGMSSGAGYSQATEALLADGYVLDAAHQLAAQTAGAQQQILAQAQRQRSQLNSVVQKTVIAYNNLVLPNWIERWVEQSPAASYGERYMALEYLESESNIYLQDQSTLAGPVRQQFEALAALDFTP